VSLEELDERRTGEQVEDGGTFVHENVARNHRGEKDLQIDLGGDLAT